MHLNRQTFNFDGAVTARLHIGCAGWSIPKAMAGRFSEGGSHLNRYARRFSAVEINSSFYRPHRPATYQRWAGSVPENFRFSVKVPRRITHDLRLRNAEVPLSEFLEQCLALGQKLGPLLLQLPPSLAFHCAVVHNFFQVLRSRYDGDVACEARHPSWFGEKAERMLREFAVARVAADPAVVPGGGLPGACQRLVYFRLHGAPRVYYSAYDRAFLQCLAGTAAVACRTGADVWCIFDNTAEGAATKNAIDFCNLLSIELGIVALT
jgi:uncharacterized protein YecE (DUF72 family)